MSCNRFILPRINEAVAGHGPYRYNQHFNGGENP